MSIYFTTKNSGYTVDDANKTITGGIFGNAAYRFESISPLISGTNAVIRLAGGCTIATSTISKVYCAK